MSEEEAAAGGSGGDTVAADANSADARLEVIEKEINFIVTNPAELEAGWASLDDVQDKEHTTR